MGRYKKNKKRKVVWFGMTLHSLLKACILELFLTLTTLLTPNGKE
jgi:hypothetical protein